MERFFDGMNHENLKTRGEGQIRKFQKHKERMEERKRRDFYTCGGSHTHVFSIGQEHPQATTLMQPSLRKTHSNWNLPYNLVMSNQLAAAAPSVGWVSCPDQCLASYFIILITTR
jgi:hypothetical protein